MSGTPFKCVKCGAVAENRIKACDCVTMVGSRKVDGKTERVWLTDPAPSETGASVGVKEAETVTITTNGTTRIIPADEPVFLIRGQDAVGGDAVRAWADLAERAGCSPDIVLIARVQAAKMDEWPEKKVADLPQQEDGR